jgi:hypothetical protein
LAFTAARLADDLEIAFFALRFLAVFLTPVRLLATVILQSG